MAPSARWTRALAGTAVLVVLLAGCSTVGTPEKTDKAKADHAAKIDPAVRDAFQDGLTRLKAEDYKAAIADFERVAKARPKDASPLLNLALAQRESGDLAAAEQTLIRAAQVAPDEARIHNELGITYRLDGKFKQAREAYEAALKLKPDYARAHLNLGVLCDLYLQQLDCALAHYKQFQALTPAEDKQVNLWIVDLGRRVGGK